MDFYKVVMIGETGVGKSSLYIRFRDNRFVEILRSTAGLDNFKKAVKFKAVNGEDDEALIQLWDTTGIERFGTVTGSYYNSSKAILLVYDVTEPRSLLSLSSWMENARPYTKAVYFLVGNKNDVNKCDIKADEVLARNFAVKKGIPVENMYMVSAKTGQGVCSMFSSILSKLVATTEPSKTVDYSILHAYDEKDVKRSCSC